MCVIICKAWIIPHNSFREADIAMLTRKLAVDVALVPELDVSPKLSNVSAVAPSNIILGSNTFSNMLSTSTFPFASWNCPRLSSTKMTSAPSPWDTRIGSVKESLKSR